MSPRIRKFIFFVFITLFVVTTPALILYTAGYRWNWQRQRIQKTGLLHVETVPRGAKVSIDGKDQKRTTPASYSRLLPLDYDVVISKDGYLPWKKNLDVSSGQTTFVSALVLYRNALPLLDVEKAVLTAAWDATASQVAYVADNAGVKEVGLIGRDGKDVLLARFPGETVKDEELTWSPRGNDVLFTASIDGAARAYRYSLTNGTLLAVHDRFAKSLQRARWTGDGDIAVTTNLGAFIVTADSGNSRQLLTAPFVQDADQLGRIGYVLRPSELVAKAGQAEAEQTILLQRVVDDVATTLAELPLGHYAFARGNDAFLLVRDLGKKRLLTVKRDTGDVIAHDATGFEWEPRGTRLLIWNDYEISIASPVDGERELVTRLGSSILQAAWSVYGESILYATPTGVSAVELDGRGTRNVWELASCTEAKAFAVQRDANMLRIACDIGSQRGLYERPL